MNSMLDPNDPSGESSRSPETETSGTTSSDPSPKPRRPRGFAAMDRTRVSEIASKGGKAAHAAGTAHQFSSDEARSAGRKGGVAPHVRRGRGPRKTPTPASGASEKGEKKEGASS